MARKSIVTAAGAASHYGPFVDGNDNVYVIVSGATDLRAYKAGTDPLVDAWTEQDSASRPTISSSGVFSCCQEGTEIHVVGWDSTNVRYEHTTFRTSDHASGDVWSSGGTPIDTPTDTPSIPACHVVYRASPESDIVVIYNGDTDRIHGTDYERCDLAYGTSGSWTVIHFGDATASTQAHEYVRGIGRGASNLVYLAYDPSGANGIEFKTFNSSDTLSAASGSSGTTVSTDPDIVGSYARVSSLIPYYDDASVEVMSFCYRTAATGDWSTRQTRGGTLQTELGMSGTDAASESYPILANDGTDLYCVFQDNSGDPEYQKSADGAAWGDITTFNAATAAIDISANVIDHGGGNVLAIVYDDGDVYYDELALAVVPAIPNKIVSVTQSINRSATY